MNTKICRKCKEEKQLYEFYRDKTCTGGFKNRCKQCQSLADKFLYEKILHDPSAKERRSILARKWEDGYRKTKEAGNAYAQIQKAIMTKRLPRLHGEIPCTDCGKPATCYDHRNYTIPLQVDPVCNSCNIKRGSAYGGKSRHKVDNISNNL